MAFEAKEKWLKESGFDGLYYPGECACLVGDLAPCGLSEEDTCDCLPGYKHKDPRPEYESDEFWAISGSKKTPKPNWWKLISYY